MQVALRLKLALAGEHAFNQAKFTAKGINWIAGLWAQYQLEPRNGIHGYVLGARIDLDPFATIQPRHVLMARYYAGEDGKSGFPSKKTIASTRFIHSTPSVQARSAEKTKNFRGNQAIAAALAFRVLIVVNCLRFSTKTEVHVLHLITLTGCN